MCFLTLTSLPWHLVQLCVCEHVGVWLTVSFTDPRNASEKRVGSGVVEKQTDSFQLFVQCSTCGFSLPRQRIDCAKLYLVFRQ